MVRLASATPSLLTRDLIHAVTWPQRECKKLGVELKFNKEATVADIEAGNWDAVIIATGSNLDKRAIPGQAFLTFLINTGKASRRRHHDRRHHLCPSYIRYQQDASLLNEANKPSINKKLIDGLIFKTRLFVNFQVQKLKAIL
jgi:hypothetical protein